MPTLRGLKKCVRAAWPAGREPTWGLPTRAPLLAPLPAPLPALPLPLAAPPEAARRRLAPPPARRSAYSCTRAGEGGRMQQQADVLLKGGVRATEWQASRSMAAPCNRSQPGRPRAPAG